MVKNIIFYIISFIFIIYGIYKKNNIKKFEGKLFINYYNEIEATFVKYHFKRAFLKGGIADGIGEYYYPIFSYKLNNDEYILKSKYDVPASSYTPGQKVTLYQDPVSKVVIESPYNGEAEANRFIIIGVIMLAFAFLFLPFLI